MKTEYKISLKNKFVAYAIGIMLFLTLIFMLLLHIILSGHLNENFIKLIHRSSSLVEIMISLFLLLTAGILGLNYSFRYLITKFEQSEIKYRDLIENLPGGLVLFDLKGFVVHANSSLLKLFAASSEKYIKSVNIFTYDPLVKAGVSSRVKEVIATGKTILHEHEYTDIYGTEYFFKEIFSPVTEKNGSITGVQVLIENITGLKEAEIQIQRLLAAVDQSANSIVITDLDGKIIFVNSFFEKITGYTKQEALGNNPKILKTEFHSPEYYNEVWNKISNGLVWDGEFLNKRKDGTNYWEKAVISPVKDKNGKIINYVAIKYDITDMKKVNEEIIKARIEAENANKAKSLFLASMSHEIRTPMNSILGFTDLLRSATSLTPEQSEYVLTIGSSAETLLALLNDILDISKIESGGLILESSVINLPEIIKNIYSLFHKSASDKGIDFSFEIDPGIPEFLIGDKIKLGQIITNLVNNAIKFTPKGYVKIILELMYDLEGYACVLFKIKDSGIGISADESSNLFKPFSQADSSTTRRFGGTGLGLSISKKITTAMDGEIFFLSRPDVGSSFIVIISFKKAGADIKNKELFEAGISAETDNSDISILICEDNQVNIRLMEAYLGKWGFNYDKALNGSEALDLFFKKTYDVILMDVQMPVMDGYEAVKRIRESEKAEGRHVPIIAMTANAMEGDREICLAAGMDEYISKPVRKHELLEKLMKFTKSSSGNN